MDAEPVPISALQHYLFCPRQAALIHVERQWAEDAATAEGRLLHERADAPGPPRTERGVQVVRGLALRCADPALTGVADVVEFRDRQPFPVEYKRGRPKAHRADEVQLCAQALCLEHMFGLPVLAAALFYGKTRRRVEVAIDAELRALTLDAARGCAAMIADGRTPAPVWREDACPRCSLHDLCQPRPVAHACSAAAWLAAQVAA